MIKAAKNRLANARNPYQSKRKKVLCVCSAGILRSPTIAWILSNNPFEFNTRSCGVTAEYALIPLDQALVEWADEVVVVEDWMKNIVLEYDPDKVVYIVETPDEYETFAPQLIEIVTPKLKEIFN